MEIHSDDTSDVTLNLSKHNDDDYIQSGRNRYSKSTPSTKLVSKNALKNTEVLLVDMILMEESSRVKHSKTG